MNNVYIASEIMGAIVILILLCANGLELKQPSKKRRIFMRLLAANGIVVVTDCITWFHLGWERLNFLLGVLVSLTYILPTLVQAIFSRYLYEHISEKSPVGFSPFRWMIGCSYLIGIIALVMCLSGKMFSIIEGHFYPGPMESIYYLLYIISLIAIMGVILSFRKKLGLHDTVVVLSFCLIPLGSILLGLTHLEFNPAVPFMAIEVLVIYALLQTDRENKLLKDSNTDELTGLLNRRAYEDDLMQYPDIPPEPNFVYASIDLNGLKQVNDALGHTAGDELISGAASLLKRSFGNYGRVYRTGGDEFVAMFFADEEHLKSIVEDLKELTINWRGSKVDSLALSMGYAEKREFSEQTVVELAEIADKRMYEDKARYYSQKGVDRRGQNDAHKVLCSLYTKILKINLTSDSYTIVNMDMSEQTKEQGFSDHISEWLEQFGKSGNVHPDDLDLYLARTNLDYMREYFRSSKTSLTILYRRKYANGFKQVMMEIIPTKEYTSEDQSLFLYVKNIDI